MSLSRNSPCCVSVELGTGLTFLLYDLLLLSLSLLVLVSGDNHKNTLQAPKHQSLSLYIMMTPNDDVMESVPLAPPENETDMTQVVAPEEPQVPQQQQPQESPVVVVDPWALPEGEPDEPQEDDEDTPSTDTLQALESLRESSQRLGSAISTSASGVDQKIGLTKALGTLDEKTHVSQAVKNASEALGGWWSSIDSKYGVTETAKELSTDFHAHVVEPLKAAPVVQESTRNLQTFDETHGITRSAASTLAKGADMLVKSLVGDGPNTPKDDERDGAHENE